MKKIFLVVMLICSMILVGCNPEQQTTELTTPNQQNNQSQNIESPQTSQSLEIVLKDFGLPEVKYLQPTIKEIQLKDQSGNWITIWSSSEGETVKLTPDGAEISLDKVNVKAGTYTETRMLVPTVDVEADINRDGDTLDKNVQIILTEAEFARLPHGEKPSAPSQPSAPQQPSASEAQQKPSKPQSPEKPSAPEGSDTPPGEEPEKPEAPPEPEAPTQQEPEKPSAPSQSSTQSEPQIPPGVAKIEGGLVYMDEYHDEIHTATPPYTDGIHNDEYLYPTLKTNFVYNGSGGKVIYDFTLHPLMPKHEQITVETSTT